jgi:hypothetical protein
VPLVRNTPGQSSPQPSTPAAPRPGGGIVYNRPTSSGAQSPAPVSIYAKPGQAAQILHKAQQQGGPGPLMGPIGSVLNFVSQPVYAVGSALQGHPLEAARHLAQLVPVVQAAEHIPGISGPAKAALNPRENILPADVSYIHRAIQAIPSGPARAAVGFVANTALDPTSYVTFGVGGALEAGARTAGRAALEHASETAARAATDEGLTTAQRLARVGHAAAEHAKADEATRAARPGGAVHVGLRVPLTRAKTVGEVTLGVPKVVKRVAAPVTRPLAHAAERIGATKPVTDLAGEFTARGGVDRVGYAVRQNIRRAAAYEKQVISQQARAFHNDFATQVKALAKAGTRDETGQKLTVQAAYKNLAHHLDQPKKFELVAPELAPFAEKARTILNRYQQSEREAGLEYKPVESYIPHVLPKQSERTAFKQRYGTPSGTNPSFVQAREVPTLEGLEHLGYTPETNVARLLELRGHASMDALSAQQTYRVLAERGWVPARRRVPVDVGAKAIELSDARARLAAAKETRPTWNQQSALASARQDIGAAQAGMKAAGKQPYFAAQMRATRGLVQARQLRDVVRPFARTGEGAVETPAGAVQVSSVEQGQQLLKEARQAVERARKRAAAAQRLKDPLAIRQARQQLTRAIHTHMDARIALAASRGRTVGTPAEIERATRGVLKAQSGLTAAERQGARVAAENRRLATLPGRIATPEEWKQVHKDWQELPGKWLKGVKVDPETGRVIDRMRDEIARSMRSPEDINALARFTQQLTGRWKSLALISPSYHWRNLIGDSLNAWWAGARNPASFVESARLLKTGRGSLSSITIKGKTYSRDEFMSLARSQGVVGSGFAGSEIKTAQEVAQGRRIKGIPLEVPGTGALARGSRRVGQAREDATRLGTFIERMKAGDDPITAANKVHEFLFDYADVSPFIDQARKFWLPFVTYASKAAPLTVKQIARNPGFFSHYARATEALNQQAGEPGGLPGLPVGAQMSFAVPVPNAIRNALGGGPGTPLTFNPEGVTAMSTLNQFDPNQIQREMTGFLNPAVKTAIELGTGHRFFYAGNAPKKSKATEPVILAHHLLGGLADSVLGYGPTGSGAPGYSPTADELLRLLPAYGRLAGVTNMSSPGRLPQGILSYLTGVRLTPYNREQAIAAAQKYGGR